MPVGRSRLESKFQRRKLLYLIRKYFCKDRKELQNKNNKEVLLTENYNNKAKKFMRIETSNDENYDNKITQKDHNEERNK